MIEAVEDGLARAEAGEVDGLRTIVADLPGAPFAVLLFRGGQADETLVTRGTLHLAEHVVCGPVTPLDPLAAQVGVSTTTFVVRGSRDDVRTWLERVAARIAAPRTDRVEDERRVLEVEGSEGAPPADGKLMAWRYGAQGPGLVGWRELGLRRVHERDVLATIGRVFTRANAVLALSTPLPGLADGLALPAGRRLPPPRPEPLPLAHLPAEVPTSTPRLAVGGPVARTPAAVLLRALLARRAWELLRDERGLAYDVRCRAYVVAGDRKFLVVGGDVPAPDVPRATALVVDEIARLAEGRFAASVLDRVKADVVREHLVDPLIALHAAAVERAVDEAPPAPASLLARLRAVTVDQVAAEAAVLARGLLALAPPTPGEVPSGLPRLRSTALGLGGTTYMSLHERHAGISVGEEGVSGTTPDRGVANVRFADCVAAVRGEDDELTVVGRDGSRVLIDPYAVQHGIEALTRVERALPGEVFVPAPGATVAHEAGARRRRREQADAAPR